MVLKLGQVWSTATDGTRVFAPIAPLLTEADLDNPDLARDDSDIPAFLRDRKKAKQLEHEHETAVERAREERQSAAKHREEDEAAEQAWLNSERYREEMKVLAADVQDAREATQWAYGRAVGEEQKTRASLESARDNALHLPGDKRVYLTRDGQHLYGEDDREITDGAALTEAQRQQHDRPTATRYEEFVDRRAAHDQAAENIEKLREAATRLDALDKRIKQGDLSPDELAQASREKQDVVAALPPEARDKYERLHAVRQDASNLSYRAADPAFAAAPDLSSEFQRTGLASPEPAIAPQTNANLPVYKSAPEF
jgi:hypothetical protein